MRAAQSGDAVQFNIGIQFPNCWDGVNLKPTHGHSNATYDVNGACPGDYPVKIPTVNMNVAYVLPQIKTLDTAKIQLSMDPLMDGDKRQERWGSIYTAHADFMNGWTVEAAHYMTERCMNKGIDCGSAVPYGFSTVEENALVDSTEPTVTHAAPENLVVSDNWKNGGRTHNPETMTLVKFPIRRCRRVRTLRCLNISCGSTVEKWKPTARIRFSSIRRATTGAQTA